MKRVAVFTSGSDAPGMNACIRSVVRTAHYYNLESVGIMRGYAGMIKGDFIEMNSNTVSNIIQKGGSILKCGSCEEFKTEEGRREAFKNLQKYKVDALVAIGGNGTFRGAKEMADNFGIPVIGIPGTIDNDVYGTDITIGYDTAVNTVLTAMDQLRDTADSHERVFFIEVMGRDSGFIVSEAAISGGAEMAIMPEKKIPIEKIASDLKVMNSMRTSHIIVVGEENDGVGSKLIAKTVKELLPQMDIRVTSLGYVQRGGVPTATDRVLAGQLGLAAVECLVNGKNNVLVGLINQKFTHTSFSEVINNRKLVDQELIRMISILTGSNNVMANSNIV